MKGDANATRGVTGTGIVMWRVKIQRWSVNGLAVKHPPPCQMLSTHYLLLSDGEMSRAHPLCP